MFCLFQSEKLGMNPLFLMLPGVIAASFAFMLPVATPPNAIVFANGYLKVTDMVCIIALLIYLKFILPYLL